MIFAPQNVSHLPLTFPILSSLGCSLYPFPRFAAYVTNDERVPLSGAGPAMRGIMTWYSILHYDPTPTAATCVRTSPAYDICPLLPLIWLEVHIDSTSGLYYVKSQVMCAPPFPPIIVPCDQTLLPNCCSERLLCSPGSILSTCSLRDQPPLPHYLFGILTKSICNQGTNANGIVFRANPSECRAGHVSPQDEIFKWVSLVCCTCDLPSWILYYFCE